MSDRTAVARLNELMAKKGIKPQYEPLTSNTGTHANTFMIRILCCMTLNGQIYTADGQGSSKKEAKHKAASAFMARYLDDQNNNPSDTVGVNSSCVVNITPVYRNIVLQDLCAKYNIGSPKYRDTDATGPPYSRNFTVECRVSTHTTNGQGSTKVSAKLEASTSMIKVLMEEKAGIFEIFESLRLTTTTNSNEIVCLNDNLKGPQLSVPIGIYGRRISSCSSSNISTASDISIDQGPCFQKNIAISNFVVGSTNNSVKVGKVAESSVDSASNIDLIDFTDDFEHKIKTSKTKSKSMTNLLDCLNSDGKTSDFSSIGRAAVNQIEVTLAGVEKQLYNEILKTLTYYELPVQRTVVILNHKYKVLINQSYHLQILEGNQDCKDASIRIASLTKLLMDIKNYAESYCTIVTKKSNL